MHLAEKWLSSQTELYIFFRAGGNHTGRAFVSTFIGISFWGVAFLIAMTRLKLEVFDPLVYFGVFFSETMFIHVNMRDTVSKLPVPLYFTV